MSKLLFKVLVGVLFFYGVFNGVLMGQITQSYDFLFKPKGNTLGLIGMGGTDFDPSKLQMDSIRGSAQIGFDWNIQLLKKKWDDRWTFFSPIQFRYNGMLNNNSVLDSSFDASKLWFRENSHKYLFSTALRGYHTFEEEDAAVDYIMAGFIYQYSYSGNDFVFKRNRDSAGVKIPFSSVIGFESSNQILALQCGFGKDFTVNEEGNNVKNTEQIKLKLGVLFTFGLDWVRVVHRPGSDFDGFKEFFYENSAGEASELYRRLFLKTNIYLNGVVVSFEVKGKSISESNKEILVLNDNRRLFNLGVVVPIEIFRFRLGD